MNNSGQTCCDGGSGGNPFDQDLNTTNNAKFASTESKEFIVDDATGVARTHILQNVGIPTETVLLDETLTQFMAFHPGSGGTLATSVVEASNHVIAPSLQTEVWEIQDDDGGLLIHAQAPGSAQIFVEPDLPGRILVAGAEMFSMRRDDDTKGRFFEWFTENDTGFEWQAGVSPPDALADPPNDGRDWMLRVGSAQQPPPKPFTMFRIQQPTSNANTPVGELIQSVFAVDGAGVKTFNPAADGGVILALRRQDPTQQQAIIMINKDPAAGNDTTWVLGMIEEGVIAGRKEDFELFDLVYGGAVTRAVCGTGVLHRPGQIVWGLNNDTTPVVIGPGSVGQLYTSIFYDAVPSLPTGRFIMPANTLGIGSSFEFNCTFKYTNPTAAATGFNLFVRMNNIPVFEINVPVTGGSPTQFNGTWKCRGYVTDIGSGVGFNTTMTCSSEVYFSSGAGIGDGPVIFFQHGGLVCDSRTTITWDAGMNGDGTATDLYRFYFAQGRVIS